MKKGPANQDVRLPQRMDRIPMPPGVMDRGPLQFDSRVAKRTGEIVNIATPAVISAPPTTTIMSAIKTMTYYGISRLPIADAGTKRLIGFVTSVDVVDFLGGGLRHNLLSEKFKNNIFVAINADISEIMSTKLTYIGDKSSLDDALKLMYEKNVGGLPIVDDETHIRAIVTEEDFTRLLSGVDAGISVEKYMSPNVVTAPAQTSLDKMTRMIIQKGFRRMPIFQDGVMIGLITASDVMRYLASGEAFEKVVTGDIREVMNEPIKSLIRKGLVSIDKGADLGEAAQMMTDNEIGALPIMDRGALSGIITERDFVRALHENRGVIS
ncbi:MAG TPA: CBS domain-containing protein [Methanotrichaceae archaeon]|nr:CBS domain-containing protein [Methanotrichaceae archaeon]